MTWPISASSTRSWSSLPGSYPRLRIGLIGDICLDRYFEIDPGLQETSIETNLAVHNVVRVRCQPGGAGTILNNLIALGVGTIYPATIIGDDGEGYELRRALQRLEYVAFSRCSGNDFGNVSRSGLASRRAFKGLARYYSRGDRQ